ncbi:MAG: TIGR00159 family protein [Chloroflexi bacterium]|nr:TIGR00159 family protein [Chloroflexota bacterium]
MPEITTAITATLSHFDLRSVIDILVVAFLLYWLLVLLRGTTAITLLRAIVAVYLAGFFVSTVFQLTVVSWLLRNSLPAMLVAVPILFQPELRRVLEQMGRGIGVWHGGSGRQVIEGTADAVARACSYLCQRHVGALIVLERETGLQDYVDHGVKLDALLTPELLVGLFQPTSPLHDGAVVLRNGRIVAARCAMPLSETAGEHMALGMRHRAAMGIAERTDAIALAVSEERGTISIASNGQMASHATFSDSERLRALLLAHYTTGLNAPLTGR